MSAPEPVLKALLIAPDREMAAQFTGTLPAANFFRVLADLTEYPTERALESQLREGRPDVVILDVRTNESAATVLLGTLAAASPRVFAIALHPRPDGEAIVRLVRAGATEFLSTPFDFTSQREVVERILKLSSASGVPASSPAHVLAFASTKPGSGASTAASQVAFALQRVTGKRVLLADFDLMGGNIGFYLKLQQPYSLLDALALGPRLNAATWSGLVTAVEGVDVLASPEVPYLAAIEVSRLQSVLDTLRTLYDFVVLDLPTVFDRSSLLALSLADSGFLVTTAELPSLHLSRKALQMLQTLGLERDRLRMIVNRLNRKDGLTEHDLVKMFDCGVQATLPNDYFSLHRVVTRGEPLRGEGELTRAVEEFALKLAGISTKTKKRPTALFGSKAGLSPA